MLHDQGADRRATLIDEGAATGTGPVRTAHAPVGGWVENRPVTGWESPVEYARELWSYRELGVAFAVRDVKVRYKQTFFGVAWAIMQPLLAVLIFTFVFGHVAGLTTTGVPYAVFVYAGMTIWVYFSSSVSAAAQTLVDNRELVSKVFFPRAMGPVAAVVPPLLDLAITLAILVVFIVAYGVHPGIAVLLVPAWIAAAVAFALAVGLWLSALNVKYRDVRHVLGFLLQLWLFASPVVYATSHVKGSWIYLYSVNPIVGIIGGFRWSIGVGPAPGPEALVSLGAGVLILLTGLVYFRRLEAYFSDLV